MEQKIVYERAEELFILSNFSFDLQCANGLLEQAKNKTEVSISFRQVSHIEKSVIEYISSSLLLPTVHYRKIIIS